MRVHLPYGEHGIDAVVPDTATVLLPEPTPSLPDPAAAVREALAHPAGSPPIAEIARGRRGCVIAVSDITRPVPNSVILPPLLETVEEAGVAREEITIVIGTGIHRGSREDERRRIVGEDVLSRYRVLDHDARDAASQTFLTKAPRGHDVYVDRHYLEAGLRILTGFVEPHLFAGYSGGGKALLPGIADAAAIMANHDAAMIGHPKATWCTTAGNPIFEEMRDVALKAEPSFIVNVTLDERKRITGVFAGELVAAHDAAIAQAERQAVRPIERLYDIVVVTNMGYPADLVLYQSVKGMSVAAQACATGGAILLAAECREGIGGPEYATMLQSETSPRALIDRIERSGETIHDQWQVQVQAMVQARCDVWLHSSLDRATVESAHLRYAEDLDATLAHLIDTRRTSLDREPTVCVLPYGQMTVPRVVV